MTSSAILLHSDMLSSCNPTQRFKNCSKCCAYEKEDSKVRNDIDTQRMWTYVRGDDGTVADIEQFQASCAAEEVRERERERDEERGWPRATYEARRRAACRAPTRRAPALRPHRSSAASSSLLVCASLPSPAAAHWPATGASMSAALASHSTAIVAQFAATTHISRASILTTYQ
jgi:hypothetical protein